MLLLSVSEFRNNISRYLQMALTENVAVKGKNGIIELTPSKDIRINPSPSNDPYFDDPRNIDEIERRITDIRDGKSTLISWEKIKANLEL